MGDESCTIDLDTKSLSESQVRQAEELANAVVMEDRPVEIRFASIEQARAMGVRKIAPELTGEIRLIDMQDFDLNACGGTHVSRTGQIGAILLRKIEKVKQGMRVEFVCGVRAISTAHRDYQTLVEAGGLYSAHIYNVPEQIRKSQDEIKSAQKERKRLLEELAELRAARLVAETLADKNGASQALQVCHPERSEGSAVRIIARVFPDRDAAFIKLLAQKAVALSAASEASPLVCLLGAAGGGQPALVFAQIPGGPFDMGALLKDVSATFGGRGGGIRDMAQGGLPEGTDVQKALEHVLLTVQQQG
jgi:alanyl-tRNA synthetase